jgi:hypothetical protein
MTKQQILERRAVLVKDLERQKEIEQQQLAGAQHAGRLVLTLDGAIQDCDYWLRMVDQPQPAGAPNQGVLTGKANGSVTEMPKPGE